MGIVGRIFKWILRLFAYGLAAALVLLVIAILLVGLTPFGARFAADQMSKLASTPDRVITLATPTGLLTGHLRLATVTIADTKGPVAEIRNLAIDWSPLALLGGTFKADLLSADTVAIIRTPVTTIEPPTPSADEKSGFSLPVAIDVARISLPAVTLGEAVAGREFSLAVDGAARADAESIAARLNAVRKDKPDAKATVDIVFSPAENRLKLDADIAEPDGGLIAGLLRLPGAPAVALNIKGEGPLSDWSGRASASLAGQLVLDVDGRHQLSTTGMHHLMVKGGGRFESLLPPALRPLFKGDTEIDVALAFDDNGRISIDSGNLATGSLLLAASGEVNPAGENSLKANLLGTSGPIDLRWPLAAGEARLQISGIDLSLTGQANAAKLDLTAALESVDLPQGHLGGLTLVAKSDALDLATRSGTIDTRFSVERTAFVSPDIDRAIRGPLTVTAPIAITPASIGFDGLAIESASIGGTLSGRYDLATQTVTSAFKLFALPAVLPDAVVGKFDTTIAAEGRLTAVLGGSTQITGLSVTSGTIDAAGEVSLDNETLSARLTGRLLDLGKFVADAGGGVDFTLSADGPLAAPVIRATLGTGRATLGGRDLTDLAVSIDGTASASAPTAAIMATAALGGQAISVTADLTSSNGMIQLPNLLVQVGTNRLEGALTVSPGAEANGKLAFDLPDLAVMAALAGQTVEGDLKGSAVLATENGRMKATISATGDSIRRGTLQIAGPVIDLTIDDLQARSAKGTIRAAELLSGNNRIVSPAVAIIQAGDRTSFDLQATYDDAPLLASGNLGNAGDGVTIGLDRFVASPKSVPLQLAEPATIRIAGGVVEIPTLGIRAGDGMIIAKGSISSDLSLDISLTDLPANLANSLVPNLVADGLISGAIRIRGTTVAPLANVDLTAALNSLEVPQGRFAGISLNARSDAFDLASGVGTIATRLTVDETAFASPDLDRIMRGPLTVTAPVAITPGSVVFEAVEIDSAKLDGTLGGRYDLGVSTFSSTFDLSILPAALPDAVAAKFDGAIAAQGRVTVNTAGRTDITDLILKSSTIEAQGKVALENETVIAELTGRLPDLGRLLADAKGAADVTLSANGPIAALAVKASLNARQAVLGGRDLTDLTLSVDGIADSKAPQASIKASGALGGQAIRIDTDLISQDGITRLPKLLVEIGSNKVEGALAFSPTFAPDGRLTFDIPDLGLFAALAGQRADGDLKGSIDLSSADGKIRAVVAASGTGIRRDDLRIARPVIAVTIDDLAALSAKGTVRAEDIVSGANRVTGLTLDITQAAGKTGFDLKADYDGAPLLARGTLDSAGVTLTVALDSFSATPKTIPLKLQAPASIRIVDGTVNLSRLAIGAGAGSVVVTGSAGPSLALDVTITSLPASLANSLVTGIGAEGVISGKVAVRGTAAAPAVDYQLAWVDAAVAQTKSAGLGALAIKASGQFSNNSLQINTTLSGGSGLSLNGGGTVGIAGNRPLSLSFSGSLPFSVVAAQLAAQGLSLDGRANVDIRIAGTAAAPAITGTVTAQGAKLIDVRRNIALNDIALAVSLDRDRATITRLSGTLAQGGTISATGSIGISGGGFPADLSIALNKAAYVDGKLVATVIDGNLTLKGPLLTAPVLGGALRLGKTSITVPEKLPASLAEINVRHKNESRAVRVQSQAIRKDEGGSGTQSSIGLDLTISAPSQIFVRGRGIDAELGGSLTVRGTATDPIVSGGFEMRRGRLIILNKRLDFTSGDISFGGSLTPTLNLEATTTSSSTTVTVTVAGVANDPTITFSSSPSLPQDEILAQLIFGQSMSKLSALQIAQLADAASQLAGGRSTSLFQALRSNLGVDDLDVSTDEKGQARVSAGKYLNKRTYIELQGGGDSGGKAIINLDVGRGVKLRGEAGGDGSGAAGIFYEKEY